MIQKKPFYSVVSINPVVLQLRDCLRIMHYVHYGLSKARVVFTIHNLEFGAHLIGKAMAYADKATTVGA